MAKKKDPPDAPVEKDPPEPPAKPQTMVQRFISQFGGIIVAALVVLSARASLADHYYVPSGSMLPTVQIGDRIIVDKRAFGLRFPGSSWYLLEYENPLRGDVVVLSSPEDGRVLLKRIVGLPGDTLEVREGKIFVDDKQFPVFAKGSGLLEDLDGHEHLISLALGGGRDWGPEKLPDRMYLVMGDNRGDSRDGRFFGLVPRDVLLGRAIRMYLHADEWVWQPLEP